MPAAPLIEFRAVDKRFGDVVAVDRLSLAVEPGEFLSFLGPSGCGKTTSLRLIAGFEQPSAGDVLLEGQSVSGVPAYRRPVNMVFQHYALFPHLDVFDNVAYGLRQRSPRPSAAELGRQVDEALELVRLPGYGRRRSHELSGGQQQRVALARALINRPKVLLLDEPLAALDRKLRRDMQIELQNLQRGLGITFVLVTHDQEEALSMSDRVAIMREGRIVQTGSPRDLYDTPADRYVADFVGKTNFIAATVVAVRNGVVETRGPDGRPLTGRLPRTEAAPQPGSAVLIAVRPELIALSRLADGLPQGIERAIAARIKNRIFLGEHTEYLVETQGLGDFLVLTPKRLESEAHNPNPGDDTYVGWPAGAALVLAAES